MGYTDMHEINKTVEKYLKTGKIAKPRKGQ